MPTANSQPLVETVKIVYWKRDGFWIGYLQDYPDYQTQGETLEEVRTNLREAAEGWLAVAHDDALARDAAGEAS